MTTVQWVARIFGWIFVVIAVWGFLVTGTSMEAEMEAAPRILGLFAVNALHNVVHLAFGIWGIAASRSFAGARSYARMAGAIYLVLAVLGFITPTTFGLIPIGGHDIWLHALIGLVLAGVGFTAGEAPGDGATADPAATAPAREPEPPAPPVPPASEPVVPPSQAAGPEPGVSPGPTEPEPPAPGRAPAPGPGPEPGPAPDDEPGRGA